MDVDRDPALGRPRVTSRLSGAVATCLINVRTCRVVLPATAPADATFYSHQRLRWVPVSQLLAGRVEIAGKKAMGVGDRLQAVISSGVGLLCEDERVEPGKHDPDDKSLTWQAIATSALVGIALRVPVALLGAVVASSD